MTTEQKKPRIGDFAHSLYWSGAASEEFTDSQSDLDPIMHTLSHRIIFVDSQSGNDPVSLDFDYNIPGGSTPNEIIPIILGKWGNRTFPCPATPDISRKRVKYTVPDKYSMVLHVIFTPLKYPRGILLPIDGTEISPFPTGDLKVYASAPPSP